MNEFPPPTDDELLLAFVEECPYMALDNYARRVGLDPGIKASRYLFEWFEKQWYDRMFPRRKS